MPPTNTTKPLGIWLRLVCSPQASSFPASLCLCSSDIAGCTDWRDMSLVFQGRSYKGTRTVRANSNGSGDPTPSPNRLRMASVSSSNSHTQLSRSFILAYDGTLEANIPRDMDRELIRNGLRRINLLRALPEVGSDVRSALVSPMAINSLLSPVV
jgi:hypothetical protein